MKKVILACVAALIILVGMLGYAFRKTMRAPVVFDGSAAPVTSTATIQTITPQTKPQVGPSWGLQACSPDVLNRLTANLHPSLSGTFQKTTIASIAKQTLKDQKARATAFTAATSTDGTRLVIGFVSCDGRDPLLNEMLPVMHVVTYATPKQGTWLASYTEYFGSNFGALFFPIGFVADSHRVLLKGGKVDMGAGGSCAPFNWKAVDVDSGRETSFSTDPDHLIYRHFSKIVYFSPNACVNPPSTINATDAATGNKQTIKYLRGIDFATLTDIKEMATENGTVATLTYNANGREQTVILP